MVEGEDLPTPPPAPYPALLFQHLMQELVSVDQEEASNVLVYLPGHLKLTSLSSWEVTNPNVNVLIGVSEGCLQNKNKNACLDSVHELN